jgi:sporulation protein YlmC with PRC-barrel domain
MLSKYLAAALIGTALIAAPAMAQTPSSAANAQTASAAGLWQASKVVGLNVYNGQNEKIGSIQQLMLDKNGTVASVVIGVGGFLGMGERDVAVKFSDLKWSNESVPSTTSNPPPATTGTGTTKSSSGPVTYPDHAVLSATKDQLKAMPQFDYNK